MAPESDFAGTNPQRRGLADLVRIPLAPEQEASLARLDEMSLGNPTWRNRKRAEARKVFGLEQLADRLSVRAIDATTELRVLISLTTPVPCIPPSVNGDEFAEGDALIVEARAELLLHYPEAILRGPIPGWAVVEILEPRHVFHANVATSRGSQRLCLGTNVPRGYPLCEAILASYAAFTLQSLAIDERDPAGVMNHSAALWFQANTERIPLSREPFLRAAAVHASAGAQP